MNNDTTLKKNNSFNDFAPKGTSAAGSTTAFISAFFIVLVWMATWPFFHFSEIW